MCSHTYLHPPKSLTYTQTWTCPRDVDTDKKLMGVYSNCGHVHKPHGNIPKSSTCSQTVATLPKSLTQYSKSWVYALVVDTHTNSCTHTDIVDNMHPMVSIALMLEVSLLGVGTVLGTVLRFERDARSMVK